MKQLLRVLGSIEMMLRWVLAAVVFSIGSLLALSLGFWSMTANNLPTIMEGLGTAIAIYACVLTIVLLAIAPEGMRAGYQSKPMGVKVIVRVLPYLLTTGLVYFLVWTFRGVLA